MQLTKTLCGEILTDLRHLNKEEFSLIFDLYSQDPEPANLRHLRSFPVLEPLPHLSTTPPLATLRRAFAHPTQSHLGRHS